MRQEEHLGVVLSLLGHQFSKLNWQRLLDGFAYSFLNFFSITVGHLGTPSAVITAAEATV